MKKNQSKDPDMLDEYSFKGAARGKHYADYMRGTNVVLLDPDVAAAFPTAEAVNEALRQLLESRKASTASGE
jgi:hypothetical protein